MQASQRVSEEPRIQRAEIVADVVRQHANEGADLYASRSRLARAPHGSLFDLRRMDGRLAAHLDGLSVAAEEGWRFCEALLEDRSPGATFVAAVRAIEAKQQQWLDRCFALARAAPETRDGLISAFGWLERSCLQGIVVGLLRSADPFSRMVGVAACGMHRVDPGLATGGWLQDADPVVRARALRAAGETGCAKVLAACTAALAADDPGCRFWAAWSATLLGDRGLALNALARAGLALGPHQSRGFDLALQAIGPEAAHATLQQLAADPAQIRWLIRGSGVAGDPTYVPWLIGQMTKDEMARLAGEAFALITGADLETLQLDRPRPADVQSGPNENPDDENVEMDPDEGLPWPDPERVRQWWGGNASRFPGGTRSFVGAPVTRSHCLEVLKNGYQRQRTLAARYLCLLEPGTPLFNTSAPSWRQQKLLTRME
jgi:uncharacterized protein (TIGR02270 family)